MVELIFLIAVLILLCGAISQGLRLANRIAVASETSAIQLAALFKSLSPEAQARANAAVNDILRSN